MIDFLFSEYYPYNQSEKEYLSINLHKKEVIEEQIRLLVRQYGRFSCMYKINRYIIQVIPVLALAAYLIMPTYYIQVFVIALVIIFAYALLLSLFFPRHYYDKISSNILILKGILKILSEEDKK